MIDFSYSSHDGWVSFPPDHPNVAVGLHVRIRNRDGRLIITDMYLHAPEITPEIVRGISVSRLQAAVSLVGASLAGAELPDDAPIPRILKVFPPLDVAGDDAPEPKLAQLRARAPHNGLPETETPERPRLTRPDGAAPEQFYPRVAQAYAEYAQRTRAPAKEIAVEAGVPVTTVHRWIREARRRGFLPPARKGKAG